MEIPNEKRLDVLLAQLQERYGALHTMRDRSTQFMLWILGLGLGLAWLSVSEIILTLAQKWIITLLLCVVGMLTFVFIYAIERGFTASRAIAIRIETALGLYEENRYGIPEPVLPLEYSRVKVAWTGHFKVLYLLICVFFLLLIFLTWSNPCARKQHGVPGSGSSEQAQAQLLPPE